MIFWKVPVTYSCVQHTQDEKNCGSGPLAITGAQKTENQVKQTFKLNKHSILLLYQQCTIIINNLNMKCDVTINHINLVC